MWEDNNKKKVLFLSYKDFAGSGLKLSKALNNKSDKYQSRFIALNEANFGAENDIVSVNREFMQNCINEADIIHLKGDKAPKFYGLNFNGKPLFATVGGSEFRKRNNLKTDFDNLHLSGITPELTDLWTPHCLPIHTNIWKKPKAGEKIRIGHAPSSREKKGTNLFIEVLKEFDNVELVLMEKMANTEVIETKKTLHLFADQFIIPAYGMNTVECLVMGIPVITSCMDIDGCPVFRVEEFTADSIRNAINKAVKNLTVATSKKHHEWAKKKHSEESLCELLESMYENHTELYAVPTLSNKVKIEIIHSVAGMNLGAVKLVDNWVAKKLIERKIAKLV